ncbi:MAG TPA: ABC transporter permease [Ohtaekwangia sp.]|nr:ABC transporter permease [Ohtaekwangia sp.]
MRTIRFLLQKEFRQIFRNKTILAMILVMPSVQLIVLPLAADYEIKNINIAIVDNDRSPYSARLTSAIVASGYFRLTHHGTSYPEGFQAIETDAADLVLEIPAGFERNLVREEEEKVLVAVNAINGMKANLGGAYLASIIRNFNRDIRAELVGPQTVNPFPAVEVVSLNRFNTQLNYRVFMVPGILAILVTMIGGFLSVLNIVKEKEAGTIEQINVTPIRKHHFILGKLIPFWVLGNVVFTIGLCIAWLIYGIVPLGNIAVMYCFVALYLLCVLGLGLLVSTFCETQQQAMFIMFFFMMVFILMGGLFTSTDSMPGWARIVSEINPVTHLIEVMRMVMLKGSGLTDVLRHMAVVAILAVIFNTWAILNYRKTT